MMYWYLCVFVVWFCRNRVESRVKNVCQQLVTELQGASGTAGKSNPGAVRRVVVMLVKLGRSAKVGFSFHQEGQHTAIQFWDLCTFGAVCNFLLCTGARHVLCKVC